MRFSLAFFIFFSSSLYVLLLDYLAYSERSLQRALVVIIVTILIVVYAYALRSWKEAAARGGNMFFIFWGTILVQLLILSTGGLQSPFFILIHLFMISLSFIFSFSLSLLFLAACLLVLALDLSFSQTIKTVLLENPYSLLILVSLIPIVPLSYILSRQYHAKDILFRLLREKAATAETIFSKLSEMIIVTDTNLHILSVNDAAVRALQQARVELLDKPLFEVLLLRDPNGKLVERKTLFPTNSLDQPHNTNTLFTLIKSPLSERHVSLHVQPVKQAGNNINQISFIISFVNAAEGVLSVTLDKARARYEALTENIKKKLTERDLNEIKTDVLLLEKIEQDTYLLQTLTKQPLRKSKIDIAKLCKQTVLLNQDFASAFQVATNFELHNFGQRDIAPLTVSNFPVKPEELTGPFFTVTCDARYIEVVIKKLLDITILLASTETTPHVTLSVKRGQEESIVIMFTGICPMLQEESLNDIFLPYYNSRLVNSTNLSIGSGLEGFLAKQISEMLALPLRVTYEKTTSRITFILKISKKAHS